MQRFLDALAGQVRRTDPQLMEQLLKPTVAPPEPPPAKPLPDWSGIHEQLRRKGVTLQLLWQEYRQAHPEGYQRSQFCRLYRQWAGRLDPVLRQVHEPGQKLFVDWAGLKVPLHHLDGVEARSRPHPGVRRCGHR